MVQEIHIKDLANPILTESQRGAIAYCNTLTVDLDRDSILSEAMAKTGLTDFGAKDFLTRLDLLLDEWNSDQGLTNLGRLSLRNKLLQNATNRLLIEDKFKQHPEIHDISIEKPIIVLGLPRSGTTHLLNLLAADARFRSLPLWESYEPVPFPNEGLLNDGTDPRYQRCADNWEMMRNSQPLLAAMHPMNPDHIHEELELMGPDFSSYNYEWLAHSPRWRDHYYANDQTPHYAYMKKVLKLLSWQDQGSNKPTRWVLKCPQHLEQIPALIKTFPDASFVVSHRDPVSVIQSAATMLGYSQRLGRQQVELDKLIAYWTDRVEHLLRACVADRELLPKDRSLDVLFHEFMADDLGTVENIYQVSGIEMTTAAQQQLKTYINDHPRGKEGRIIYNLESDFGVSRQDLHQRFQFYFDRFPVQHEYR